MVAARDLKYTARIGENSLLDILDPGSVHADRDLVLRLAGHRTRVAPDALSVVDNESVFHTLAMPAQKAYSIILGMGRKRSQMK